MTCLECTRKVQARSLCNTHYHRARRAWIEDGVDLFPLRSEVARAIRLRPVTCRHRACVQPTYLHDVCADHLADTLAAGYRARRFRGRQGTPSPTSLDSQTGELHECPLQRQHRHRPSR